MSDEDITIRLARTDEADNVTALVQAAYSSWVDRLGMKPAPMLDDYVARVAAGEAWVADVGGTIVGLVVLIETDGPLMLDNVAVHPSFRHRGLGGRLIAFAETHALETGSSAIDLYAHEHMTENIELYQRLGFQETRRVPQRGFMRVYMRKQLAAAP